MKIMKYKQLALGIVIGAFAMSATGAYAAVGDQVEAIFANFNLVINGQSKQADTVPLVYNGTSYLPVRDMANLFGYDVTYKADSRTIEFTTGTVTGNTYGDGGQGGGGTGTTTENTPVATTNADTVTQSTTPNAGKNNELKELPHYVDDGVPALQYQNTIYVPISGGSLKYGIKPYIKFDSVTKVISITGTSISAATNGSFYPDCFAFTVNQNIYIREDLLVTAKDELHK